MGFIFFVTNIFRTKLFSNNIIMSKKKKLRPKCLARRRQKIEVEKNINKNIDFNNR